MEFFRQPRPRSAVLVPTTLPVAEIPGLDLRMLVIAAIATLGTGVGFGVLPALRATREAVGNHLRDGARSRSRMPPGGGLSPCSWASAWQTR